MDGTQIAQFFSGTQLIHVFFKLFSIIIAGLYVLYAIISIRQIKVMNDTLQTAGQLILQIIALLQLLVALVVFVAAFVLL